MNSYTYIEHKNIHQSQRDDSLKMIERREKKPFYRISNGIEEIMCKCVEKECIRERDRKVSIVVCVIFELELKNAYKIDPMSASINNK